MTLRHTNLNHRKLHLWTERGRGWDFCLGGEVSQWVLRKEKPVGRRASSYSENTGAGQWHETFVLYNCPSTQPWLRSSITYPLGPRAWSEDLTPVQPCLPLHWPAGTISICFYIHFYINFILLEISLKPTSSVDMCKHEILQMNWFCRWWQHSRHTPWIKLLFIHLTWPECRGKR